MMGVMRGKRAVIYGLGALVLVLSLLFVWLTAGAYIPVLAPSGVVANQQRTLFWFTVGLSALVVIPVFVLLGVFAWRYRAGNRTREYQPEWSENNKLEAIWWGIPIAIIGVLAVVTYITSHSLDPYRPIASSQPPIEVKVVALQWKWLFIYPEYEMASVNDLTIPVDRPVHFSLTADAPMSAFWVPALGSQIYSMNSMSSQLHLMATQQGTYKGYNTNVNGTGYADMVFDVHVVDDAAFKTWTTAAVDSGNHLTRATFDDLSKPSISQPQYFHLHDKGLYDAIVMQNMGQSMTTGGHMMHDDNGGNN